MTEPKSAGDYPAATPPRSLAEFLQTAPPLIAEQVVAECAYNGALSRWEMQLPSIRLYCASGDCDGESWFDPDDRRGFAIGYGSGAEADSVYHFARYTCRHCRRTRKVYALYIAHGGASALNTDEPVRVAKFGEIPPAIGPTSQAFRELLGKEAWPLYLKGRQAELAGLGIGAFVYYRRVVEHIWQRVLARLIAVAALEPDAERQAALGSAKAEPRFTQSLEAAKGHIPASLYVDGHNPFQALYDACGDGIHELNDEECIGRAQMIRLVLTRFAERAAVVVSEDKEFRTAVGRLTNASGDR